MEELASSGRIDPAFLQITAKAYGAARDTEMTLDEAKWVSYRLYLRARDYFDRQQPKEKRILGARGDACVRGAEGGWRGQGGERRWGAEVRRPLRVVRCV